MNIRHQYITNAANYEGKLVEIDTLFKLSGAWPAADSSGLIYLTNQGQTDTTEMFIYAATKIGGTAEPAYPIDVMGIAGQYSSGPTVVTGGYYIDPRNKADINHIVIAGVNDRQSRAYRYHLYQNYPNPFNPTTTIRFEVPSSQKVVLSVYDVLGRKVEILYNSVAPAGITALQFDGSNLASGAYIYTIKTTNLVTSRKLMLLK